MSNISPVNGRMSRRLPGTEDRPQTPRSNSAAKRPPARKPSPIRSKSSFSKAASEGISSTPTIGLGSLFGESDPIQAFAQGLQERERQYSPTVSHGDDNSSLHSYDDIEKPETKNPTPAASSTSEATIKQSLGAIVGSLLEDPKKNQGAIRSILKRIHTLFLDPQKVDHASVDKNKLGFTQLLQSGLKLKDIKEAFHTFLENPSKKDQLNKKLDSAELFLGNAAQFLRKRSDKMVPLLAFGAGIFALKKMMSHSPSKISKEHGGFLGGVGTLASGFLRKFPAHAMTSIFKPAVSVEDIRQSGAKGLADIRNLNAQIDATPSGGVGTNGANGSVGMYHGQGGGNLSNLFFGGNAGGFHSPMGPMGMSPIMMMGLAW